MTHHVYALMLAIGLGHYLVGNSRAEVLQAHCIKNTNPSSTSGSLTHKQSLRVIIKFKKNPQYSDPCYLKNIPERVGVKIEYIANVSDTEHIYLISQYQSIGVKVVLEKIQNLDGVHSVELDEIMSLQ